MKTPFNVVTAVVITTLLCAALSNSTWLRAQQPVPLQAPVSVVVNPSPKFYRVFDISRIAVGNGQTPAGTMESVLNELGTQGWKVAATSGSFVIMMQ